jgi:ribosome maturation factor RimP
MQSAIHEIVQRVEALATPLVEEEGIELWGIDLRAEGSGWVLRLALDREGGVTLDDLTRVHRQLSDLLDVHDLIPWRYTLEVSSPGINRPLVRPRHYRRYLGQRVRVQTREPYQGRRVFVGTLGEVGTSAIRLLDAEVGEVQISWGNIRKATSEYEFPAPRERKKARSAH